MPRCRTLVSGKKLTGVSLTGSVKLYNATSRLLEAEGRAMAAGEDIRHPKDHDEAYQEAKKPPAHQPHPLSQGSR